MASAPGVSNPHGASNAPSGSAQAGESLVHEARREIAEIVREVAAAVRSDRSEDDFLGMLSDRILRAMAAEGVVIWRRLAGRQDFQCRRRLGRWTDQSIADESIGAHRRMLAEVAADGQPVVVPATPGATDPEVPANPSGFPVALAPMECDRSPSGTIYLLEVYLEPGCGVATQRGYLRFVAQMADLAGEFLRADLIRRLQRKEQLALRVDAAITALHDIKDGSTLAAAIVDQAAELFGFDRTGLCRHQPKVVLEAVSHVSAVDRTSPAAEQLRQAAEMEVEEDGCRWMDPQSDSSQQEQDALELRAVVRAGEWTLIAMQRVDESRPSSEYPSSELRGELVRYLKHAGIARTNLDRLHTIPGLRLLGSPRDGQSSPRRSLILTGCFLAIAVTLALIPVPLVVYAPGSIRPTSVQTLASPRDAVVDQVHVRHGQEVVEGQPLITLSDPALEAEITRLSGQLSLAAERRAHWTATLVHTDAAEMERLEELQAKQRLASEEIRSIEQQLALLHQFKDALRICAQQDGIVDAWQIEHRLPSRPLRRGDHLMQVVSRDSSWTVDARVPQTRITHVQHAETDRRLTARVVLDAEPGRSFDAYLEQVGPVVPTEDGSGAATTVRLTLDDRDSSRLIAQRSHGDRSGAPGSRPVPVRQGTGRLPVVSGSDPVGAWNLRALLRCGRTPAEFMGRRFVSRPTKMHKANRFGGRILLLLLAPIIASGLLIASELLAQTGGASATEVSNCLVRFSEEVDVPALETGRVAALNVARNDSVSAGDAIARLDDRSLLIRRRRSQQLLQSAKAVAQDDFEIRDAELALAEAEAEYETSLSIQNDVRGAVPRSQVRKLKIAVERRRLQLEEATKRNDRATDDVALHEVDLSLIDELLRNLHVESPIDGVILDVKRSVGEWIEKGETIMTICRIDRLHVTALVSRKVISSANCRGWPVSVHWIDPESGQERTLPGKILSADPQLIQGDQIRVHAEIVNRTLDQDRTQWMLQPGAEVRLKVYASVARSNRGSGTISR